MLFLNMRNTVLEFSGTLQEYVYAHSLKVTLRSHKQETHHEHVHKFEYTLLHLYCET